MAGRDGPLKQYPLVLPQPLYDICKRYQNDRFIVSFNAAVIELLETHPEIARRVAELYAVIEP